MVEMGLRDGMGNAKVTVNNEIEFAGKVQEQHKRVHVVIEVVCNISLLQGPLFTPATLSREVIHRGQNGHARRRKNGMQVNTSNKK